MHFCAHFTGTLFFHVEWENQTGVQVQIFYSVLIEIAYYGWVLFHKVPIKRCNNCSIISINNVKYHQFDENTPPQQLIKCVVIAWE